MSYELTKRFGTDLAVLVQHVNQWFHNFNELCLKYNERHLCIAESYDEGASDGSMAFSLQLFANFSVYPRSVTLPDPSGSWTGWLRAQRSFVDAERSSWQTIPYN